MSKYRSFIFYGALFGALGVKGYLDEVAVQLGQYGVATTHYSTDNSPIGIANNQPFPVILWGFSLGANQTAYVSLYINKPVVALVAMDPSKQSPLCPWGLQAVPPKVHACLCLCNTGAWLYGGCQFRGNNVEIEEINKFHLAVPFDRALIAKGMRFTREAIARYEKEIVV